MHIITSFLGYIGTLMKDSCLDVSVGAAFGSMNGIITGVAWGWAMRAFRMVLVTLLQNFIFLFFYLLCQIYPGVPHQCAALFSLGLLHYMHDKTNINQHTFSYNTVTTLTTWYIHHYMHNVNYKEDGNKRRNLEFDDRETLSSELAKHSHPLTVKAKSSTTLSMVRSFLLMPMWMDDAVDIGQTMAGSFRNSLPNGFLGKISNKVKTMEQLKRGIKVGGKTVFDLEAIFIRLLVVG